MKRQGMDGAKDAPRLAGTRAAPGIEPGTSRTLSENHATRPSSLLNVTCSKSYYAFALPPTVFDLSGSPVHVVILDLGKTPGQHA